MAVARVERLSVAYASRRNRGGSAVAAEWRGSRTGVRGAVPGTAFGWQSGGHEGDKTGQISLLLGRYPTTTETIDFARPALLGRDWVTLPQHFRQSGYEVQLLGKIFHYPEPKPWSAGGEAVRKEQEVHHCRRLVGVSPA